MNIYQQWAQQWGIPLVALADLERRLGIGFQPEIANDDPAGSEARQQSLVRLEAPKRDCLLFRNNVGALMDDRGVPVRYGLANENKAMNERWKSSDLIGIRRVLVTPAHVGRTLGVFLAREMKHEGWKFKGDSHEAAQLNFIDLVNKWGGDACFATGPGTL